MAPPLESRLQTSLAEITALLRRHRVIEALTHRQEGPRRDLVEQIQHRQNLAELNKRLRVMHAADIAYVLQALPQDDRRVVWDELALDQAGLVLVEVSGAVRDALVAMTAAPRLMALLQTLDPEDVGYVAESLPPAVLDDISRTLAAAERSAFEEGMRFDEDSVGHYMTREWVAVGEELTVEQGLASLRLRPELPQQTDRIFITDARGVFRGAIPLQALVLQDPQAPLLAAVAQDVATFRPHDKAREAVKAFERYDLVSAPVVNDRGKIVGRLTVDAAMDALRHESELRALQQAGLSGDEDLFGAPWTSARNRWPWLGINLVTAFAASRVIGRFEGAIEQLAALAALMPVVASVGGNTGNQTMALVVRALALGRLPIGTASRLIHRELAIGLLNGLVWGSIVGLLAVALYGSLPLAVVMSGAVVLNLLVAAVAGVGIPLGLSASGRDPARGSSVLLTFITDAMGFLLFLGLATIFLL